MFRHAKLVWVIALILNALTPCLRCAGAEENAGGALPSGFKEITEAQDAAIEKAAAWLAKNQGRDGSWTGGGGQPYNCTMTGLAGLALLSHGDTPGRGKYGDNVLRAVRYLLKQQDK